MPKHSTDKRSTNVPDKLNHALATLLEAFEYALDTESERWDFAVPNLHLRELGLNESDMRWLVRKGFVEHAREVTVVGDDGREFRATGNITFARRTCFVLTDAGVAKARSVNETSAMVRLPTRTTVDSEENGHPTLRPVVHWDADARKLCVNGEIAKRFKWRAANQESVLNAFQEEGWPDRIDDPLPPQADQDPKRRLSDTIKCLNRKQTNPLIHFHGDGTGEGVVWELNEPSSGMNGVG